MPNELIVVFVLIVGGYNTEGVWIEQEVDRNPFANVLDCIKHVKELPAECKTDSVQGCLKEDEHYWCVPILAVQEGE